MVRLVRRDRESVRRNIDNGRPRTVRRRPGGARRRAQAGVNAWANAPDAEKAARFASAETVRWLEWGMRSSANFNARIGSSCGGRRGPEGAAPATDCQRDGAGGPHVSDAGMALRARRGLDDTQFRNRGCRSPEGRVDDMVAGGCVAGAGTDVRSTSTVSVRCADRIPACPTNPTSKSRIAG